MPEKTAWVSVKGMRQNLRVKDLGLRVPQIPKWYISTTLGFMSSLQYGLLHSLKWALGFRLSSGLVIIEIAGGIGGGL